MLPLRLRLRRRQAQAKWRIRQRRSAMLSRLFASRGRSSSRNPLRSVRPTWRDRLPSHCCWPLRNRTRPVDRQSLRVDTDASAYGLRAGQLLAGSRFKRRAHAGMVWREVDVEGCNQQDGSTDYQRGLECVAHGGRTIADRLRGRQLCGAECRAGAAPASRVVPVRPAVGLRGCIALLAWLGNTLYDRLTRKR